MIIDYDYLASEFTKCYKDKSRIYMIQNYLKTYDATQRKEVPFQLFPRQQDLCTTLGNANNVVTTKPRQAGITTTTGAFIACEMCLADKESPLTMLCIGNTLDLAQQMLVKVRDFVMQFPLWMWGDEYMDIGEDPMLPPRNRNIIFRTCNSKEIVFKNGCKVVARSSGPDASRGVGGVSFLCFDEAAFIENGKDVYASALPTVSTGGHIIMISTPNGKDMLYYETCRQAKLKGTKDWNNFELVEMKWYQDPRYNKFLEWTKKDEENGEIIIQPEEYLDKQGNIKFDNDHWNKMIEDGWLPRSPWYIKMCQQFNNDSQKIAQELDVSFLGSASNVVEPEFIEMQQKLNMRDPLYTDPMVEDTWIWKEPIPGHRYLCACLPEGELVQTSIGYKNIEDVIPTDLLINEYGNYEHIKECKRRFVTNEKLFNLRVANNHRIMKFTSEHPILASESLLKRCYNKNDNVYNFNERYYEHKFQFYKAIDLKEGMWVALPNRYLNKEITIDELIYIGEKYEMGDIISNKDFWYYCGIWLAEGCTWLNNNSRIINTTHNANEVKIIEKIANVIEHVIQRSPIISCKNNTLQIRFTHKNLFKFLNDTFGKYSYNKNIPEWVKLLPWEFKKEFVLGYFHGDGSIYTNKRDGILISFGSTSLNLLENLQDMFYALGMLPCLSLSSKPKKCIIEGREVNCKSLYELKLQKTDTIIFKNLFLNEHINIPHRHISNCHFSKNNEFIYFQIKKIDNEVYNGYVYNFETKNHTFCASRCITHNCDPSRGDAADRTAIEILDMDGIDDDGTPCLEQVLEYQGKMTGDVIGELIYKYATMYGNAFTIVECIGGVGDAAVLMLQRLGYKNLYYDDPELKTYTMQRDASSLRVTTDGKLPGFHSSSVRFQMLTGFANMVKTNQIKIRSKRVIAELDTWIYKGTAARIDHQDGCHDDTLTCLAMGTFVMNYSMKKYQQAVAKDKIILKAWTSSANLPNTNLTLKKTTEISVEPTKKYGMPFYTNKNTETLMDSYRWLIK